MLDKSLAELPQNLMIISYTVTYEGPKMELISQSSSRIHQYLEQKSTIPLFNKEET